MAESLKTLRNSLPAKDATQHVIDTIEQAFLSIMQSLQRYLNNIDYTFDS